MKPTKWKLNLGRWAVKGDGARLWERCYWRGVWTPLCAVVSITIVRERETARRNPYAWRDVV